MANFDELEQMILEHGGFVNRIRKEQRKRGVSDVRDEVMKDATKEVSDYKKNPSPSKLDSHIAGNSIEIARDAKKSYLSRNGENGFVNQVLPSDGGGKTKPFRGSRSEKNLDRAYDDARSYDRYKDLMNNQKSFKQTREERLQDLRNLKKKNNYELNKHQEKMAEIESKGNPTTTFKKKVAEKRLQDLKSNEDLARWEKEKIAKRSNETIDEENKILAKNAKQREKDTKKGLKEFRKNQKKLMKSMKESTNEIKLCIHEFSDCGILTESEKDYLLDSMDFIS